MCALEVKALVFDVFGTVVDWRTSIIRQGKEFGKANGVEADWDAFADAWRGKYGPSMNRVRTGELPWTNLDALHRMALEEVLTEFNITGISEEVKAEFNLAWHKLDPWPDSVPGLWRLKAKHIIAPMSNGNIALMTNMAKNAGLPWDCVLSAELSGHYKPDAEVYEKAADLLSLPPHRIMMVAAHKGDLRAAQRVGFKAAWVPRPLEYGPSRTIDTTPDPEFDYSATDFIDLAAQL